MTTVIDPWPAFVDALPRTAGLAIQRSASNDAALRVAIGKGWALADLVRFCAPDALGNAHSPAAVVAKRLREAAGRVPLPDTNDGDHPGRWVQPKPWCGGCSDRYARWSLDPDNDDQRCSCWTQPPPRAAS